MASKVRALRALRSLGDEEDLDLSDDDEEVTEKARAKARALYGPVQGESAEERDSGESGSDAEDESGDESGDDDGWERFFDVGTSNKGKLLYTCKLLGKTFTSAEAARVYVGGKLHRRAVSEAQYKMLTYNEKQELEAKREARKARRKQKALEKHRQKVVAKRKATKYALKPCAPQLLSPTHSSRTRLTLSRTHLYPHCDSLSEEQIASRKARFAIKKQRRLERKVSERKEE